MACKCGMTGCVCPARVVYPSRIPALRDAVVEAARVMPPSDGKPAVRPHTIQGWWQVWSGGICLALLTPDDVAPILAAESARKGGG